MLEISLEKNGDWSPRLAGQSPAVKVNRQIVAIAMPQAASGMLAIAALPFILFFSGGLSIWEWAIALWAVSQLPLSFLPKFGWTKSTLKFVDLANLSGLMALLLALTGGLTSFLLPWLMIIPAEAALMRERKHIVIGVALVAGVIVSVWMMVATGWATVSQSILTGQPWLFAVSTGFAIAYMGALIHVLMKRSHESQTQIEQREDYYRSLTENARDIILRFGQDGSMTGISAACEDVLGYRQEKLLKHSLDQLIHRADRKSVEIGLSQAHYFGNDTTMVFRIRHSLGHYIWLELRCRAVPVENCATVDVFKNDQSEPAGTETYTQYEVIGVARDITELKQVQEGLQRARDVAETANQSKSQFLANISHELRTPLNAIIGFSDMMKQEMFGPVGDEHYKEYARLINDSGAHLLDLISDLLDMSKIEAGKFTVKMERLFFPIVIENCLKLIRLQAERARVKLSVDLPESMQHIKADPRACRQILLNLLSNAIKFTPPGGMVTVRAKTVQGNLELEIQDTGVGIPPQMLVRLGQRFEQAEETVPANDGHDRTLAGTGLGLALVRSLAELHDGDVSIESRMGEGTTVRVVMPTREDEIRHQEDQADLPLTRESVIERHMARLEEFEAAQNQSREAQPFDTVEYGTARWPPLRGAA